MFSTYKQSFFPKKIKLSTATLADLPISEHAFNIISRLQRYGYEAYLVGGCVRDLLLNKHPKDFDVVTSAAPKQIRKIFNNSRIIGRRFQLVHIYFRDELIEVATYRAKPGFLSKKHASGMLLRDNKFGNRRSDALRRDFTINALYFDPCAGIIIDYFDGMSALKAKSIQIVGCPKKRFREDPIRILRAIRFAAKLQWPLGKALSLEIQTSKDQIYHASAERLLVEVQKFLMTGHAVDSFYKAMDEGLVSMLFPAWSHAWEACFDDNHKAYIQGLLYAIDKRYKHQETLSLSFALAALFWPLVLVNMRAHASEEIDAPADWLQSKAYWTIKKQSFADMTCLLHISAELKRRIEGLFDFQCGLYQIENASMLDSKTAPQGIQMMSLLCRHHLFPWQLAQQWHERFYQA